MSFECANPRTSTAALRASAPGHVASKPKEDDMRKIAYQMLIASLFVAVLAPLAAWAQTEDHLKVDVPFQFRAGNTLLPAGRYLVEPVDESEPNVLVFRGINNHAVAIVPTLSTERSTYQDKSGLDFNKVGNQEVLTKIWVGGEKQGYQILENEPKTVATASNSHSAHRSAMPKKSGM